ncbi:MAG: GNAT family N-acetyltransferase [Polyangiaceae bacterium]
MSPQALRVRPATEDDLDRLVAIHVAAFPDDRGAEARRRNFTANAFSGPGLRDLRVGVAPSGEIVAHAFLFQFGAFFAGHLVQTAGIASVGVAPEARGRGVATALLGALHEEAAARGDAIALLYPFRAAFYRRLGYAPVTPLARLTFSPRAIPASWHAPRSFRAARGDDLPALVDVYLAHARRTTGLLQRPASLWERKLLNERRHVIVLPRDDARGGPLDGYVTFRHAQREPHAATDLEVDEIVAIDDAARRALLAALAAQRDQVREIHLIVPSADPLLLALEDADRAREGTESVEHPLGVLAAGPMVKILDVPRALAARGVTGALPVPIPAGVLAALAFGGVRAIDAVRLGWLDSTDKDAAALDACLALPPFEVVDPF